MKTLRSHWKVILALLLLMGAALVYVLQYLPARTAYEGKRSALQNEIRTVQLQIAENRKYEPVQTRLEEAAREVEESRTQLYSKFPTELKEEDHVLYLLDLEEKFNGEVTFRFAEKLDEETMVHFTEELGEETVFHFGEEAPIVELSDGTQLQCVTLTLDFVTTYSGFKNMVQELAVDDVIASVRYAEMGYDTESDRLAGKLIVTRYVMSDGRAYQAPAVKQPAVGKENIYRK